MKMPVRRKRVKVFMLLLCIMMLAVWVFSVLFASAYVPPSGQQSVFLAYGQIGFGNSPSMKPGWACAATFSHLKVVSAQMPWIEFARQWLGFSLPGTETRIPVWLLVVAVGIPTGILWWRDRRPKDGLCTACGYDLTGNVSGACPECGTAVESLASPVDAGHSNPATKPDSDTRHE